MEVRRHHGLHWGDAAEAVTLHSLLVPVWFVTPGDCELLQWLWEDWQELLSRFLHFGQPFSVVTGPRHLRLDLRPLDLELGSGMFAHVLQVRIQRGGR